MAEVSIITDSEQIDLIFHPYVCMVNHLNFESDFRRQGLCLKENAGDEMRLHISNYHDCNERIENLKKLSDTNGAEHNINANMAQVCMKTLMIFCSMEY